MTTSSGFTVMFFFTNLRFGFSVVSGSVTAATTTERRALTALPDLAPKRACAVVETGTVSGQTGRRVESRLSRAAFPAADAVVATHPNAHIHTRHESTSRRLIGRGRALACVPGRPGPRRPWQTWRTCVRKRKTVRAVHARVG